MNKTLLLPNILISTAPNINFYLNYKLKKGAAAGGAAALVTRVKISLAIMQNLYLATIKTSNILFLFFQKHKMQNVEKPK